MKFGTTAIAKKLMALGGVAALSLIPAQRTVAQPTPTYTLNGFYSGSTTWGNAGEFLNSSATPVTLTSSNSSIDNVFAFTASPLQNSANILTSNSLGNFNLNSMVFSVFGNPTNGIVATGTSSSNTFVFNAGSAGALPTIYQTGTGRATLENNAASTTASPVYGITLAGGTTGTTLQILGSGTGDVYLNTGISQTGSGSSGLLINQTGTRNLFTGSIVRLGGLSNTFTGGVNLTSGNLMLSNVMAATTGTPPTYTFNGTSSAATTPINALGTGTLTINGGSLQFDPIAVSSGTSPTGVTGTLQVNNAIQLNATLNLTGIAPGTAPSGGIVGIFASPITGTSGYGLNIQPTNGTLVYGFNAANTFNGPIVLSPIATTTLSIQVGTAATSTGSFTAATSVTVVGSPSTANTGLILDDYAGVQNRLPISTPLTLNRGNFAILGNPTTNTADTLGTLTVNGMGQLSVYTGSATATGLTASVTFGSLNRGADGRGTLAINATNYGGVGTAGAGNGEGYVFVTADPGGEIGGGGATGTTTQSILPYAMGNAQPIISTTTTSIAGTPVSSITISPTTAGPAVSLVRYDSATGKIVPLNNSSEYASSLYLSGTTAPSANQRYVSTSALPFAYSVAGLDTATTANALVIDSNTASGTQLVGLSVQGASVLTLSGGALLVGSSGGTASVTLPSTINLAGLAFGSTTAYVQTSANLAINAPITGSGGLVKSQFGTLYLTGTNSFTGGLTINAGTVQFGTDASLGASGGAITLNTGIVAGLNFLSYYPSQAPVATLTVSRPITIGVGNGGISVALADNTLTLSGTIGGSGQFYKSGSGVLSLTGSNNYTGNTVVSNGTLAVQNDSALGSGGAIILAGGALQPLSSFSTSRDILVTTGSTIFTGGQNLTVSGNLTSQAVYVANPTLLKDGPGDLTFTSTGTYTGTYQDGTSAPTVRGTFTAATTTAGRTVLSGANGALPEVASFLMLGNGELVLDNSAAVNTNRVGIVSVSMGGGKFTLNGNAGASLTQQIGALSYYASSSAPFGGIVTLSQPTSNVAGGAVLQLNALSVGAGATSVGTLFIRGTNLGGTSGDRTAFVVSATSAVATTNGIVIGALGATSDTAADPTTFLTVSSANAAAPNASIFVSSILPLASTGYTAGAGLSGTGASGTTYDVTGGTAAFSGAGLANAIRIGAGGAVTIATGSTLTLSDSMILTTGGANGGISGGTLAFGAANVARISVSAGSDLTVSSALTSTATGFVKSGGGNLTLTTAATLSATVSVAGGTLTYGIANALPITSNVFIGTGALLDLGGTASTVATVQGYGNVTLGSTGSLTLNSGTAPVVALGGAVSGGAGSSLIKTGTNTVTLAGDSTVGFTAPSGTNLPGFSGTTSILAGQLTVNANNGLGTSTILLGDTASTGLVASLVLGNNVTSFSNNITVQSGAGATAAHIFSPPLGIATISSNIVINNTSASYASGNATISGIGLRIGLSGLSGLSGGSSIFTGTISGVGGILIESGNYAFNGTNTYSGPTEIDTSSATTIGIATDSTPSAVGSTTLTSGPLGTGTITFTSGSGANLRADGGTRTIANTIDLSSGGATFGVFGTNALNLNGTIDLQGATVTQSLNILNSATTTINGVIQNGTGGITKNGPGVLAVTNTNTYSGTTTVNAGTLLVNTATGLIPGAVQVNPGAIFGGTGTAAGAVTLAAGGILSAGSGGSGTLTLQSGLTTVSGSILSIHLTNSGNAGATGSGASSTGTAPAVTSNTYLNITGGGATLAGGILVNVVANGLTFNQSSYSYLVGNVAGTDETLLMISGSSQFSAVGFAGFTNPTLTGDSSGNLYLNFAPVPEPASMLAIGGAAFGVLGLVRRRRRNSL